jgi:hypothetical protein
MNLVLLAAAGSIRGEVLEIPDIVEILPKTGRWSNILGLRESESTYPVSSSYHPVLQCDLP